MNVRTLIGSGDKIAMVVLPVVVVGVVANVAFPTFFEVGGPSEALRTLSLLILVPGLVLWAWSVVLILTRVPRGELITTGPFALVKHPIYTSVALLVLPWVGFLLNTWLGALLGIVLYLASRRYAPQEEAALSDTFGAAWDEYVRTVRFPGL